MRMEHLLVGAEVRGEVRLPEVLLWLHGLPERIGMTRITPPQVEQRGSVIAGIVLLAESHASIHMDFVTRWACVDVFSCKPFSQQPVCDSLEAIGLYSRSVSWVSRGPVARPFPRDYE